MAIVEYFNPEHSVRKEVVLFLAMIGTALSLISFVATEWALPDKNSSTNPVKEVGLWRVCRYVNPVERVRESCFVTHGMDLPDWFIATQILCTMGFTLQLVTLILVILSECCVSCRRNVTLEFTFIGTGLASVIFLVPALVLFGEEVVTIPLGIIAPIEDQVTTLSPVVHTYKIAWAFYLIAAGTAVQPICAILGIWDAAVEHRKYSHQKRPSNDLEGGAKHHPYGAISNHSDSDG